MGARCSATDTHCCFVVTWLLCGRTLGIMLLFALCADASVVQISNLEPKRDVHGEIVNAHDGTYRLFDGFWLFSDDFWVTFK